MQALNRKNAPQCGTYSEKIIQFGEGNFLRGFIDWIVWNTNKKTNFNASVAVVQPIAKGMVDVLNEQDGLYHLNLQGMQGGKPVDTVEMIDVVSRGINPYEDYDAYLKLAEQPEIRFIISNTTEAGITFDPTCRLDDKPASSYPGKLVQLLFHRFRHFHGAADKGVFILPCELIFENGKHLKECIYKYIDHWNLGKDFAEWFERSCSVCCTLVDRITPGYPRDTAAELNDRIGYEDKLLDKAEIFHLWVIEYPLKSTREESEQAALKLQEAFPVGKAGLNILFVPSEAPYHERKVTLLNGPHTVLSPVGYLSGLNTVKECCEDPVIGRFVHKVMYEELMQTLNLPENELQQFADDVMERFRNPFVKHFVTSIMLNSFPKFRTRDLPGLKTYLQRQGRLPAGLVMGLAGICTYYAGGMRGEDTITPNDDPKIMQLLSDLWKSGDCRYVAEGVLAAEFIWDENLNSVPGLTELLAADLELIKAKGMLEAVKTIL